MEKPKYLSAINQSLYVIIIILTIIKLAINFTDLVYTSSVILDIIFNFIILICTTIMLILYKHYFIRFMVGYVVLFTWIGALVTSILSYKSIIKDSKMKAIYNFSSYTKLTLCFVSIMSSISDEDEDEYDF